MVQISLGRVVVLSGIVIATILYFILPGLIQEAEGAFCADTCQKRLAEQKGETTKSTTKTTINEPRCYGIYCDKNKDKTNDDLQTKYEKSITTKNFIAIRVSEACQISGTCPTIKELGDIYDNSDRYLSGDFYFDEDEQKWKRSYPPIYNVFEIYKWMNLPWVVFVEPDDYTWDRSKKILIESQLHYVDRRDKIENQVRVEYEGLSLDSCNSATIGWMNNGSEILLDVLNHFYSNCKERVEFDPTIEIFMNSTIFPGCDENCFSLKEQFKHELKADHLITAEEWERNNCKNDDESKYSKLSSYDRNKAECDRVRASLDLDDDDDEEPCYGIYCEDKKKVEKPQLKTAFEKRQERIKELEDIQQCKEDKIWDELKVDGTYRRHLYDCNNDEDRKEYADILLCEQVYDEDVDCNDEDERKDQLKKINEEPPPNIEIIECEKFKAYELTIPERKQRASIVTCEDQNERDEYLQEIQKRYPNGLP